MELKESVQHQFGRAAADYRSCEIHAAGADLAQMIEHARLRGDERVLDVGCGAGHTGAAFAPHVGSVEGLDLTPAMLEQSQLLARERGLTNFTTRQADVERLPYPDGSFDVVTCRQCAHHFSHPVRAVAEISRVLRRGGRFVLVDSVAPEEASHDTFLNTIERLRDPSHVRDHSVSQWQRMLAGSNLAGGVVERFDVYIEFESWIARQRTGEMAVSMLKELLDTAHAEIRAAFRIGERETRSFELSCALLVAEKR